MHITFEISDIPHRLQLADGPDFELAQVTPIGNEWTTQMCMCMYVCVCMCEYFGAILTCYNG